MDGLLCVCPHAHDDGGYDVSWLFCLLAVFCYASSFSGDLSAWDVSAVTGHGALSGLSGGAPHAISAQAHMSSSHWLLGGGLQCDEDDREVCVSVVVVLSSHAHMSSYQ